MRPQPLSKPIPFVSNEFRCNTGTILFDPYAHNGHGQRWMFIRLDGDIITVTDPIDTVTTLHAFHIHQYSEWTVLQFGAYKPMFDENGPIHRQGKAVPLPENVLDYVADLPLPNTL